MEALEAAEAEEEALKGGGDSTKERAEGIDAREKQLDNVAKLEGYLDGEINDLFDARDMHG